MFKKILKFSGRHKIITGIIILFLIVGGFFGYRNIFKNKNTTSYTTATVEKGTLIVSVTGTGQISASNQIDIKSKASGDVLYFNAQNGQEVKKGQLLLKLDDSDAQKAVRDAEITLQSAELDLQKMKGINNEDGTIRGTKEKAEDDLEKAYEDGFNAVSNAFLDLPSIMTGLQDVLFSHTFSPSQENIDYYTSNTAAYNTKAYQYKTDAYDKYQVARQAYDQNFQDYKSTSRFSEKSAIESLIDETYETVRDIAETVKSSNNLIQLYKDELTKYGIKTQSQADTHLSTLGTYTSKTNSYLSSLLSIKDTIESSKESIVNAGFDIADQEIIARQKEEAFSDAQKNLENYSIYAPFDGIIAATNIEKGDTISSGTSVATIITKQKVAEITLNEVDVAKVKIGQKATITFDAVSDLSITGEVAEIDTLGTVSQGVISYAVKITFDTQDDRVKSGMSASVVIITEVKQDVLMVPNNAVKSQDDSYYVEIFSGSKTLPQQKTVGIGVSNDSYTEIVSGLKEGDKVVVKTSSTQTKTSSSSSAPSLFENSGGRGVSR